MENLTKQLDKNKIEINWNKNPIPMDLFLSFLTVPIEKVTGHLGECTGWTKYQNKDVNLIVGGGIHKGHWLNSIEYGTKLENPYNNYVNPFYIFDIMNDEGKNFFKEYYKEEIVELVANQKKKLEYAKLQVVKEKEKLQSLLAEYENLKTH